VWNARKGKFNAKSVNQSWETTKGEQMNFEIRRKIAEATGRNIYASFLLSSLKDDYQEEEILSWARESALVKKEERRLNALCAELGLSPRNPI
jgi:hypothetical protein